MWSCWQLEACLGHNLLQMTASQYIQEKQWTYKGTGCNVGRIRKLAFPIKTENIIETLHFIYSYYNLFPCDYNSLICCTYSVLYANTKCPNAIDPPNDREWVETLETVLPRVTSVVCGSKSKKHVLSCYGDTARTSCEIMHASRAKRFPGYPS